MVPFQFSRSLFLQPRPGTLNIGREELKSHLEESYSDALGNIPLSEIDGLVNTNEPAVALNAK